MHCRRQRVQITVRAEIVETCPEVGSPKLPFGVPAQFVPTVRLQCSKEPLEFRLGVTPEAAS